MKDTETKFREWLATGRAVKKLREMGHEVTLPGETKDYHFRVDEVFDFFHPRGQWHDLRTGERGNKPMDQMALFIHRRLEATCNAEESQVSS